MKNITLTFLILLITAIFHFVFISHSYGSSPYLVRQDIRDKSNDMIIAPAFDINRNNTINQKIATDLKSCTIYDFLTNSSLSPYGDITEVSYLSDSRFFNTTLWINDYINFANPLFPEGIDIFEIYNLENKTFPEFANQFIKSKIHEFDLNKVIYLNMNESITLGKESGLKFEVLTKTKDASLTEEKYLFVIVEHKNRFYAFVFSSLSHRYDTLLDDVRKVMKSFQFIDNVTRKTDSQNYSDYYTYDSLKIRFKFPPNSKIDDNGYWIRINFPTYDFQLISKSYQILMDVKSTFDNGIDYIKKVSYENSSKKWKETFYETKSLKESQDKIKFEDDGNLRIIEEKEFTKFPTTLLNKLVRQNFYVPISVDLSDINFPSGYDVYFVTTSLYKTNNNLCNVIDATSFTPIPPPKINITVIPDSLEIRSGEEKNLEVRIDPSTRLPYRINLESEDKGIIYHAFTSNILPGIHKDIFITNLKISVPKIEDFPKTEDYIFPKYYSLPINVIISIVPSHKDVLTNAIIQNKIFSNITSTVYLPIKVHSPLNTADYINSVSEKIASPLGTIMTTLGLIVGSIVGVSKWFLSQKKVKEKRDI